MVRFKNTIPANQDRAVMRRTLLGRARRIRPLSFTDLVLAPFDWLAGKLIYAARTMLRIRRRLWWQAGQTVRLWMRPPSTRHVASAAEDICGVHDVEQVGDNNAHVAFSLAVIGLAAKLIRADGRETPEEYQAFCTEFPMPETEGSKVRRLFNEAGDNEISPRFYARCILSLYPDNREMSRQIIRRLFAIAAADRPLNLVELRYLRKVAEEMTLSMEDVQELSGDFMSSEGKTPYELIGVRRSASPEVLRDAYHRKLRACHPDTLADLSETVEDELEHAWIAQMTRRAAVLTDAYDSITRSKGFRKAA